MLRIASIAVSVVSLLFITAIVNGAGNAPTTRAPLVVEVSALRSSGAATSQPIAGKPESSIKALADQDGAYLAEVTIGERVVHLSGKLKKAMDEDVWRVELKYSDTSPGNVQSITSNIMTPLEQPKTIGGLNAGDSSTSLVLTLRQNKPDKK